MYNGVFYNVVNKFLELINLIENNCGMFVFVGGCVRDILLKKVPKDFDAEVYFIEHKVLIDLLAINGYRFNEVGLSFNVIKIFNPMIDISLPRIDNKTGVGHKGFDVVSLPYIKLKTCLKRRDFTINSLAYIPKLNIVLDYFNGIKDIFNKYIKITNLDNFRDDPLRVLRGIKYASKFGVNLHYTFFNTIKNINIKEISMERISNEIRSIMLNPYNLIGIKIIGKINKLLGIQFIDLFIKLFYKQKKIIYKHINYINKFFCNIIASEKYLLIISSFYNLLIKNKVILYNNVENIVKCDLRNLGLNCICSDILYCILPIIRICNSIDVRKNILVIVKKKINYKNVCLVIKLFSYLYNTNLNDIHLLYKVACKFNSGKLWESYMVPNNRIKDSILDANKIFLAGEIPNMISISNKYRNF